MEAVVLDAEEEFLTRRLNNEGAKVLEQFFLEKARISGVKIEKNDDGENLLPDALIALHIMEGLKHVEDELGVKI